MFNGLFSLSFSKSRFYWNYISGSSRICHLTCSLKVSPLEDGLPWRTDTWLICPWWSFSSPKDRGNGLDPFHSWPWIMAPSNGGPILTTYPSVLGSHPPSLPQSSWPPGLGEDCQRVEVRGSFHSRILNEPRPLHVGLKKRGWGPGCWGDYFINHYNNPY